MYSNILDYLRMTDFKLVEASLTGVLGSEAGLIEDEVKYQKHVVDPAWNLLPVPIRFVGKGQDVWSRFFGRLRGEVFDVGSGSVEIRAGFRKVVEEIAEDTFAAREDALPPLAEPIKTPEPSEPDPVTVRSERKATRSRDALAVGIDLGTTNSLVAFVDGKGQPRTVANARGKKLTPSMVLFAKEGTTVGEEAVDAALVDPDSVADFVKRDMGAKVYRKKLRGEYLPPEVISSFILRNLKADVEREVGPARWAVITVPAYFEETRRRATMDAGRLAGLEVLDIINEPTAAAIAYGYHEGFLKRDRLASEKPLRVLVYDLGGGTFDVTILEIRGKKFDVLATDGDVFLGGADWDRALIELAAERFRHRYREDPLDNPFSMQSLLQSAEAAKRKLTKQDKATITVSHIGSQLEVDVTRREFEEATSPLVERTRMTTELVARQAGLSWSQVDRVLLVGGSTRMPMITEMLAELTEREVNHSAWVDEAVVQGAALYAELLAPRRVASESAGSFSITDVNAHSLGVEGSDPKSGEHFNKILIPKNTRLPYTVTKKFKTFRANQHNVVIRVLEGENERPGECTQLGVCRIKNLPADLPVGWPIEVSYTYKANGRLHVDARLQGHEACISADLDRANSMPDEDLDLWSRCIAEELREDEAMERKKRKMGK